MEETSSCDDEKKFEEHVDAVTSSVTSPPLTPAPKKSKTQAERQREYRLRQKKKKEAQYINGDKPAKKTRADYQREYRLRKKLNAKLNSGSAEMIQRQEAGPSGYLAPVTTAQLTPSSPTAGPIIIQHEAVIETVELPTANRKKKAQEQLENVSKVRKFKRVQQYPTGDHNFDEICQLPSQPILTPHLPNDVMPQISNQHVENLDFDEFMQPQDFYDAATMEHGVSKHVKEQLHTKMSIKTEVEEAATSNAHFDSEINVNRIKEEPGLVQFVKSEPALLVKSEILEDSMQDPEPGNKETPPVHQAQSQLYVCDDCPKVFKYKASFNVHQIYEHSTESHKFAKQKITNAGIDEQQGAPTTSIRDIVGKTSVAADSVKQGQLLHIKEELEDTGLDIGPTVLQHMDSHYGTNQTGLIGIKQEIKILNFNLEKVLHGIDDGKVVCSQVRDETVESSWKDNKTTSCKYYDQTKSERDYHETHLKLRRRQQKDLQQTTSYSILKCDACEGTFHKPHLPFLHKKQYQLNKNKTSVSQICALTRHKRVHTGDKPYQCDRCHARFTRRFALTTHMKVHTGEKPYQCDTCDARFAHSGSLTTHMRTHSGEKPYQCDMCYVRFAQRNHLTVHMRRHTGEKPYQCDTCNARFAHSNTLTTHKRVHTGEKAV